MENKIKIQKIVFPFLFTLLICWSLSLLAVDICEPPPGNCTKFISPRIEGIYMTTFDPTCFCKASCSQCGGKAASICHTASFTVCSGEVCQGTKTGPECGDGGGPSPTVCPTMKCYKFIPGTPVVSGNSTQCTLSCTTTREGNITCKYGTICSNSTCTPGTYVEDAAGSVCQCTPPNPVICPPGSPCPGGSTQCH